MYGPTDYSLDVAGKKAEVQLIFPFRGLAAVRVGANVKGITVEEITVRAGGAERKGKGTGTLGEKDGKFTVTGVAVEEAPRRRGCDGGECAGCRGVWG